MAFEYDTEKSLSNKQKHGVDFEEIQTLWEDDRRLQIKAKTVDEKRDLVIGRYKEKIWSCIITYKGKTIRIISARRAHIEEVQIYESDRF